MYCILCPKLGLDFYFDISFFILIKIKSVIPLYIIVLLN